MTQSGHSGQLCSGNGCPYGHIVIRPQKSPAEAGFLQAGSIFVMQNWICEVKHVFNFAG